jgi:membrane protein DedA with SNARE-associated domain
VFSNHTLNHLLSQYGYLAVFLFVMIESLGVPFPGETMVIAAALYAGTTHHLIVWLIWAVAAAGAIIGDNIGFGIGHWGGFRLLRRYGKKVRLDEAKLKVGRLVFDRHGPKVVFFGRFISILRTYAAFLAGTNRMHYWVFLTYNAAGGIVWSAIYVFGFYYLGNTLKHARGPVDYGLGAAAAVIVVGFAIWTARNRKRLEAEAERAYPGPLTDSGHVDGGDTGAGSGGGRDGWAGSGGGRDAAASSGGGRDAGAGSGGAGDAGDRGDGRARDDAPRPIGSD